MLNSNFQDKVLWIGYITNLTDSWSRLFDLSVVAVVFRLQTLSSTTA